MQYPNRFPFDVLDPDPVHCVGCGCDLSEGRPEPDCQHPASCHCHHAWREHTDDLEKRWLWGDR